MVMVLRISSNQTLAHGFLLLILVRTQPSLKPWLLVLKSLSIITLLRSILPLDLLDPQDPLDLQVQMEQTALMELLVELPDLLDLLDLPDLPDLLG
jgi:hypothetical protein